jgi:5-formyltetrahydrofolate cyclo-ligase
MESRLGEAEENPGERKRAVRSALIAERARLSPEERSVRSHAIARRAAALPVLAEARTVALYAPLGSEVDALELARLLRQSRLVFPRIVPQSRRLAFACCAPRDLVRGPLGAGEPPPGAPEVDPAEVGCVVVPGIGFSRDGLRLGRGGGYYDATLRDMAWASRLGIAFDLQVVADLPHEPHDTPLDALVTEARVLAFPRETR